MIPNPFRLVPETKDGTDRPFAVVLGIAQDGGYPQPGCRGACCRRAWQNPAHRRHVACLAVVDPAHGQRWLIDATPDFKDQLHMLDTVAPAPSSPGLAGILLTHAHVGHYTGLVHLGREAMGAQRVPVHATPGTARYLCENGPWSLLVSGGHIDLGEMPVGEEARLNERLSAVPLAVPHRGEYSDTVAFRIRGPDRSVLYVTDIDGWAAWDRRLEDEIAASDVAFLDGTFYDDTELPGRDLTAIPHPFVAETVDRLQSLPQTERAKVRFTHLNHTNPLLRPEDPLRWQVEAAGFRVAAEMERVAL